MHHAVKSSHHFLLICTLFSFLSSLLFTQTLEADVKHKNEQIAASDIVLRSPWTELQTILNQRLHQKKSKMKLTQNDANSIRKFLFDLTVPTPKLLQLKLQLPKTTLELLRAIHERNLPLKEAEEMAAYLSKFVQEQNFKNVKAFDENTSHIIGREWSEIDYSGEGMTWQGQRKKYAPYGITDFKSKENLVKFLRVESTLPYFKKIYREVK